MNEPALTVQMIPVDQIYVLNLRSRNKVDFQNLISNISTLWPKETDYSRTPSRGSLARH